MAGMTVLRGHINFRDNTIVAKHGARGYRRAANEYLQRLIITPGHISRRMSTATQGEHDEST